LKLLCVYHEVVNLRLPVVLQQAGAGGLGFSLSIDTPPLS